MTTTPTEPTPDPVDLEAIRQRLAQYAATDEGDAKHWALAGVLVASVPLLLAEIERLAALADAIDAGGLLVEPGSETRVEWGCEIPNEEWGFTKPHDHPLTVDTGTAWTRDQALYEAGRWPNRRPMRRTIHTGPWQPVDASGETP